VQCGVQVMVRLFVAACDGVMVMVRKVPAAHAWRAAVARRRCAAPSARLSPVALPCLFPGQLCAPCVALCCRAPARSCRLDSLHGSRCATLRAPFAGRAGKAATPSCSTCLPLHRPLAFSLLLAGEKHARHLSRSAAQALSLLS
jgi:hypothetical protein